MNIPPDNYFKRVKGRADYEALSRGDFIPEEWTNHFPTTYYEHKVMTKLYKKRILTNGESK